MTTNQEFVLSGIDTSDVLHGKTITAQFIDMAEKYPKIKAIISASHSAKNFKNTKNNRNTITSATYSELLSCVSYAKNLLTEECNVKRHDRVGILVPGGGATPEYLVSMLAVLCCGAVYVPIDLPSNVALNDVVQRENIVQTKCIAIIRTDAFDYLTKPWTLLNAYPCIRIDSMSTLIRKISSTVTPKKGMAKTHDFVEGSINDDVCVIFTSGSTGKSKPVLLSHRGIQCRINWSKRVTPMVSGQDGILFQLSTTTLGGTMLPLTGLLQGCTVFVARPSLVIDIENLAAYLALHRINFLISMPSLLKDLIVSKSATKAFLSQLKVVYLTGESYNDGLLQELALVSSHATLVNLYGMTETTGHTISHIYSKTNSITDMRVKMGLPTDNVRLIILNSQKHAATRLENAIIGELCVSGSGMSKGYEDKAMNQEKSFIHDEETFFRTGDLVEFCRVDKEEYLRYAGRLDRCVKISGFRVELDGVENVLCSLPGVTKAAVITNKSFNADTLTNSTFATQIIAFVNPGTLYGSNLRTRCLGMLPKHAVPVGIYPLDEMPLTDSGKIDRKILSSYFSKSSQSKFKGIECVEPSNGEVKSLLKFIQNALVQYLGPCEADTNIFNLGATSITVASLVHALQPFSISASDIYELKTPRKLAECFSEDAKQSKSQRMPSKPTTQTKQILLPHSSKMLLGHGFFSTGIPVFLVKLVIGLFLPYLRRANRDLILEISIYFHNEPTIMKLTAAIKSALKTFPLLRARYKEGFFKENMEILSELEVSIPLRIYSAQNCEVEKAAARRRISYGYRSSSLVEFLYDNDNNKLTILCDHVTCDHYSMEILSKHIVSRCNDENGVSERRPFCDFSQWQHNLNQNNLEQDRLQKKTPVYGVSLRRKLLSHAPFSFRSIEVFHTVPFHHSFPMGVSPKVAFLTFLHSMITDFGGPSVISIVEIKDLRFSSCISGFEHTFGSFVTQIFLTLTYLSSISLVNNMTNLMIDLKGQEESMTLWEIAHGYPTIVRSEGWVVNFIDTRNQQADLQVASVLCNINADREQIAQRDPAIYIYVFFDGKSISFQIAYCTLNLTRQMVRAMGNCIIEKIFGFGSSTLVD